MSDDPIGDALHAEAEAARAEIRATGIVCPSCGVNMADLPDGHELVFSDDAADGFCVCGDGQRAEMARPGTFEMAVNVLVHDAFRRQQDEVFRALIYGSGRIGD